MDNVSKVGCGRNHIPCEEEYMDNDIIFLNGIKDLPMADGVLRVDRFVSISKASSSCMGSVTRFGISSFVVIQYPV